MADNDGIVDLASRREASKMPPHVVIHMPPPQEWPAGPFMVTISDKSGKMCEVVFPDHTGILPENTPVMGTAGIPNVERLYANLLAGAIRTFAGSI